MYFWYTECAQFIFFRAEGIFFLMSKTMFSSIMMSISHFTKIPVTRAMSLFNAVAFSRRGHRNSILISKFFLFLRSCFSFFLGQDVVLFLFLGRKRVFLFFSIKICFFINSHLWKLEITHQLWVPALLLSLLTWLTERCKGRTNKVGK